MFFNLHQHLFSDEMLTIAQGRTTCHSHGMITALANQNDQVIQSIPDGLKSRPTFFSGSRSNFTGIHRVCHNKGESSSSRRK